MVFPSDQLDNPVLGFHRLAIPEQHVDTFLHFFPLEAFPADGVDYLVDTGTSPFPADVADGILDNPDNVPLLLGYAGDNLVDIKGPCPRIVCNLAKAGIDNMDDPFSIAQLDFLNSTSFELAQLIQMEDLLPVILRTFSACEQSQIMVHNGG